MDHRAAICFVEKDDEMKRCTLIAALGLVGIRFGNAAQADFVNPDNVPAATPASCDFFTSGNSH